MSDWGRLPYPFAKKLVDCLPIKDRQKLRFIGNEEKRIVDATKIEFKSIYIRKAMTRIPKINVQYFLSFVTKDGETGDRSYSTDEWKRDGAEATIGILRAASEIESLRIKRVRNINGFVDSIYQLRAQSLLVQSLILDNLEVELCEAVCSRCNLGRLENLDILSNKFRGFHVGSLQEDLIRSVKLVNIHLRSNPTFYVYLLKRWIELDVDNFTAAQFSTPFLIKSLNILLESNFSDRLMYPYDTEDDFIRMSSTKMIVLKRVFFDDNPFASPGHYKNFVMVVLPIGSSQGEVERYAVYDRKRYHPNYDFLCHFH